MYIMQIYMLYIILTLKNINNRRYGKFLTAESYSHVLIELTPHISDQDLHLLPLALNTVVSVLRTNPASLEPVNNDILPSVFQLVQSTLVQGAALDSLLV